MDKLKINTFGWIMIIFILLIGLSIWWSSKSKEIKIEKQSEMTSRQVALLCTTDMATEYHIHPEIYININGKNESIPKDIGIKPGCMTSIHTHSSDGIIHVESPVAKDFTLGDFFAVWQKDFSRDKLLDYRVNQDSKIIVSVNGEEVDTYENTILKDKDKIVISYQAK